MEGLFCGRKRAKIEPTAATAHARRSNAQQQQLARISHAVDSIPTFQMVDWISQRSGFTYELYAPSGEGEDCVRNAGKKHSAKTYATQFNCGANDVSRPRLERGICVGCVKQPTAP